MDESGVDNRIFREYARAKRGIKILENIPGKKRTRISVIAGLFCGKMVGASSFVGGCNTDIFNAWLENILLKSVPKNSVIIMDNASFHKSPKTKEIIEKAGCVLKFLPTYSPDFNPIEHMWYKLKSILKKLIPGNEENLEGIIEECLRYAI